MMSGLGRISIAWRHTDIQLRASIAEVMVEIAIIAVMLALTMAAKDWFEPLQIIAGIVAADVFLLGNLALVRARFREATRRRWFSLWMAGIYGINCLAFSGCLFYAVLSVGEWDGTKWLGLVGFTAFFAMMLYTVVIAAACLPPRRCPGCDRRRLFLDLTIDDLTVQSWRRLAGRNYGFAGCIRCGVRCRRRLDGPWMIVARPAVG